MLPSRLGAAALLLGCVLTMPAQALQLSARLGVASPGGEAPAARAPVQLAAATSLRHGLVQRVLDGARARLGTEYVLGGNDVGAVDCSSLVQQAYRAAGVELPRTAREQRKASRAVRPADAREGDLMFYRWRGGLHVALYMSDDTILHASPSAGRVVMTRLNENWRRRLVGVTRLL